MNSTRTFLRVRSGLVLAAFALMTGIVLPSYCQGRPVSGDGTISAKAQANWAPTGNLNTPRHYHTATLLSNGNVLVVGGYDNALVLSSAELYESATGTWNVTGSLNTARSRHTATLLQNGKVLVSGGEQDNNHLLNSAEVYDPATGTWSLTGSLAGAHGGHTATLLPNGKVLVTGGTDNFSRVNNAELYDPVTGTWGPAGSPTWSRISHTATLLQDGTVLVAGGVVGPYDPDFEFPPPSKMELYDPVSGAWKQVGADIIVSSHTATLLLNGKVLLATGNVTIGRAPGSAAYNGRGAELYDPAAETWSYTGSLTVVRSGHTASLLPNAKVLVAGGKLFGAGNDAELYDPDTGMWTGTSSLIIGRSGHTGTLLDDGRVLVAGGVAGGSSLATAELYGDAVVIPGAIGPGFTGSWYDPAQSGHGLFIEVLPDNRLLAAWSTFNPAGTAQAWFVGVGSITGNTASITAIDQPTGGRWMPNFDPARIVHNAWGTLMFTFTDCNHGRVDFNSVLGYGTGSMNLTRLTQPAGVTCP